jgi:hypothetical protein
MLEHLHSGANELALGLRNRLRWLSRPYSESASPAHAQWKSAQVLPKRLDALALSEETQRKTAATLWILEAMELPRKKSRILEGGSQDFQRLLAFDEFWPKGVVEGWELDPYPILRGFVNRWEKAKYYQGLCQKPHQYKGGDFFSLTLERKAEIGLAFFPFVSPDPALAWGLPARYGDGLAWAKAMARNLEPGGLALFVHQGPWEEESFDQARMLVPQLVLEKRLSFRTPHLEEPHEAHASVYRVAESL